MSNETPTGGRVAVDSAVKVIGVMGAMALVGALAFLGYRLVERRVKEADSDTAELRHRITKLELELDGLEKRKTNATDLLNEIETLHSTATSDAGEIAGFHSDAGELVASISSATAEADDAKRRLVDLAERWTLHDWHAAFAGHMRAHAQAGVASVSEIRQQGSWRIYQQKSQSRFTTGGAILDLRDHADAIWNAPEEPVSGSIAVLMAGPDRVDLSVDSVVLVTVTGVVVREHADGPMYIMAGRDMRPIGTGTDVAHHDGHGQVSFSAVEVMQAGSFVPQVLVDLTRVKPAANGEIEWRAVDFRMSILIMPVGVDLEKQEP